MPGRSTCPPLAIARAPGRTRAGHCATMQRIDRVVLQCSDTSRCSSTRKRSPSLLPRRSSCRRHVRCAAGACDMRCSSTCRRRSVARRLRSAIASQPASLPIGARSARAGRRRCATRGRSSAGLSLAQTSPSTPAVACHSGHGYCAVQRQARPCIWRTASTCRRALHYLSPIPALARH